MAHLSSLALRWLAELDARPIASGLAGAEVQARLGGLLPEQGEGLAALGALEDVLAGSRAQNGRFAGYVLGSGEPVAAAADLLASALNQNVTAWRSGGAAVTVERAVVASLAAAVGCDGFAGSLTGGGSAANLMGLALAREAMVPANDDGAGGGVVYASTEAHMSIAKAVALLGIGRKQLRPVPVDAAFRMRPDVLDELVRRDLVRGERPFAIVATAGTVNTGAVDPLAEVAEVAREHGLWLHVDGAYGALAAIAVPDRFEGLNLADSLSLDPHKWLYQPLDCGCLLYRDRQAARRAFSDTGDYAKVLSGGEIESFAFFDESIELSRRFRALKLWLSWRFHGLAGFREAIRRDLHHAQLLAALIGATEGFEVVAPVELSAVCFRAVAPDGSDEFNAALLARVNRRGDVYLSNATIAGRFALRACFTNHRTTDADVERIVAAVREEAASPVG